MSSANNNRPVTTGQLRDKLIAYFRANPKKVFGTIHEVRGVERKALLKLPAEGTIFGDIAKIAAKEGVMTDGTIGSVARTVLGWAPGVIRMRIYTLACDTHEYGTDLTGLIAAQILARMPR